MQKLKDLRKLNMEKPKVRRKFTQSGYKRIVSRTIQDRKRLKLICQAPPYKARYGSLG